LFLRIPIFLPFFFFFILYFSISTAGAVDLGKDFAQLRDRQYYIRVGLENPELAGERTAVRVVCDGEFVIHDQAGKVLYTGTGDFPVKVTYGGSGSSLSLTYYYILNTYAATQRKEADAYAERVSSLLKRPVDVLPDPRSSSGKLAVMFGPLTTAEKNAAERAIKQAFPSAELYRPSSSGSSGGTSRLEVRDARGRILAQTSGFIGFRPKQREGLIRVKHMRESYAAWAEPGMWRTKDDNRAYRGMIEVWVNPKKRLSIINRVFLEHYLYGVVQPEIGANAPFEMKKVQAVISRSEVIAKLRMHRHEGWHYDMCDQQCCQVYKGALVESPDSNAAVEATWGQVCVYGDNIADAVYSHSCGGATANTEDLWGGDAKPYLRSTMDSAAYKEQPELSSDSAARRFLTANPPCFCNPNQKGFPDPKESYFRWTQSYTAEALTKQIRESEGSSVGRVVDIRVSTRTKSGRVKRLSVTTSNGGVVSLSGEMSIRGALRIKSTFFVIEPEYDGQRRLSRVTIRGAGYGHGVGLCQMGAIMMAKYGYNYLDILKHYFHGVGIWRIYQ
jgi:SpoIID/LytB domain protein